MHRFAARQSIVDKDNNVFAYEMLFRDSLINVCPKTDANFATVQVIETTLASRQSKTLTKHKPAFINFTLETLEKGYPLQFKQEHIIVELLETEEPSQDLLNHCKNLHTLGYQIALDDFIHHQDWHNFFPYISIIKVDFQQTGHEEILELIEHLTDFPDIQLLAEKLENKQEHTLAINLGFELFQGFLFDKPEVIKSKMNTLFNFDLPNFELEPAY